MPKKRILIVDDAVVVRRMLSDMLEQDPDLEVVGTASNGKIALDKIPQLDPDIIITQSQCEVCAVSLDDVESAVESLSGRKPKIISLQPNSLADIWNDIKVVSRGLDVEDRGLQLIKTMKDKIQKLNQSVKDLPIQTVACIEWIDPLMAAGNWVPTLVELVGGENLLGEAGKHSPWMGALQLSEHMTCSQG